MVEISQSLLILHTIMALEDIVVAKQQKKEICLHLAILLTQTLFFINQMILLDMRMCKVCILSDNMLKNGLNTVYCSLQQFLKEQL